MTGSELLIEGTTLTFPKSWFVRGNPVTQRQSCVQPSLFVIRNMIRVLKCEKTGAGKSEPNGSESRQNQEQTPPTQETDRNREAVQQQAQLNCFPFH